MARIITYRCDQCGSRIVVDENLESHLSPVYCCGIQVAEVSTVEKKPKRKTAREKKAKKKIVKRIKTAVKKKTKKTKKRR